MRKILLCLVVLIASLTSCTENQRARQFGGTITIELPPGEKLVMATWKETFKDMFGKKAIETNPGPKSEEKPETFEEVK